MATARIPVEEEHLGASLVRFHREFLRPDEAGSLLSLLLRCVPWREREIVLFGRRILQPRLVAWLGDPDALYTYSGVTLTPEPWPDPLRDLRARVEGVVGQRFNSVLANLYRNEADSMGMHSDDEPELGPDPTVASVSLGETRRFTVRPKAKGGPSVDYLLPSGSLLVMTGSFQSEFRHGIPKERTPRGPRINLTFRRIYPRDR